MPFIVKSSIDKLLDSIEIVDVIENYITVQKAGVVYKACCPFHEEKTPSFTIYPKTGTYKCFGCGEGGNALDFVINFRKLPFIEAIEDLAKNSNFSLEYIKGNEINFREQHEQEMSLLDINRWAKDYYHKRLMLDDDWASPHIFKRGLTEADIKFWELGFAGEDFAITNALKEKGKLNDAHKLGIVKKSDKGNSYDKFQNRIIIPIHDRKGNIIAFGGKSEKSDKKIPKYINSDDCEGIYEKSKTLYGLYKNADAIRRANAAYLVEGYFDVISLVRVGVQNTVASCGTALTEEQAKLLRKFCEKVIIFYDGDTPGWKATLKALEILLKFSFQIYIVTTPGRIYTDVEEKIFNEDPDTIAQKFEISSFLEKYTAEALPFIAAHLYESAQDTFYKGQAIAKISELLSIIPNVVTKQEYIKEIADIINFSKSTLKKEVDKVDNERIKKISEKLKDDDKSDADFPNEQARISWLKYGFYEDDRFGKFGYWFNNGKKGKEHLSNFLMKSLYLIEGDKSDDSKRIIEIRNEINVERIIDLRIKTLNSIPEFKSQVEKLGKFVFRGSMGYLDLLKLELYDNEKHCKEVKNLGWQSEGFYAFANGVYDCEKFTEVDSHGVVLFKDQYYFTPALSKIYVHIKNAYKNDKKFIHISNKNINFKKWSKLFNEAHNYGDNYNGSIAILFFCAAIFRDHIFESCENYFPILFLFGKPQTGKTKMAEGLLAMFGIKQDVLNLSNTTKAGISKKLAEFTNALAFLDEYKNTLEVEIVQFTKSIADGQGRNKSDLTADEKTTSTPINSAAIIAGQDKPTADIALFTRCIMETFMEREFNKDAFDELTDMQKDGLTSITLEVLRNRFIIEKDFKTFFRQAQKDFHAQSELHNSKLMSEKKSPVQMQERLITSVSCLFGAFACLETRLEFPFTKEEIKSILFNQILKQSEMITYSNDISTFWDCVQDLFYLGLLQEGTHFKIANEFDNDLGIHRNLLFLQFKTVHSLYAVQHRKQTGKSGMDKDSLLSYLKYSKEFIRTTTNTRFSSKVSNSAHIFDYDEISKHINLIRQNEDDPKNNSTDIPDLF